MADTYQTTKKAVLVIWRQPKDGRTDGGFYAIPVAALQPFRLSDMPSAEFNTYFGSLPPDKRLQNMEFAAWVNGIEVLDSN